MSLNFPVMQWARANGAEHGVTLDSTMEEMEAAYRKAHPATAKSGKTHTARSYVSIVREGDTILGVFRGATIDLANEAALRFALTEGYDNAVVSPIPSEDFEPGEKSSAWIVSSGPPVRGRKPGQSVKPDLTKVSREDLLAALNASE